MSNQFSAARFGRLFRKHTAEQGKGYLMSVGVLIGLLALVMGGNAYLQTGPMVPGQQAAYFGFFLVMAGLPFTGSIFAQLADKKRAIGALMLPASHLEKYLVGWLYSFVLFTLVFTACFYLVISVVVQFDHLPGQPAQLLNIFTAEPSMLPIFLTYAFLHAIVIWGALFFGKQPLIRTGLVVFLALGLVFVLNTQLMKLLVDNISSPLVVPFGDVDLGIGKEHYQLALSEGSGKLVALVPIIMGLLFWVAAYFRVQEKEI
ncbi:hypothetical protein GCM10022408_24680 [Hymenobacter fastidiosus]|uniref:ABC transporter permease n=1 Tax=Hymenobacter fastidiosus TaxID=486264 RepID=A0ABP7SGP4_9BACT